VRQFISLIIAGILSILLFSAVVSGQEKQQESVKSWTIERWTPIVGTELRAFSA